MWPFSGIRGQTDKKQSVLEATLDGIRSTAGSVSSARLDPRIEAGSAIWSGRLTDLFSYWRRKFRNGGFPSRADIDPLDIPALLPVVFLVDVEGDPADFRFRLVGSEFARKYGADITGRTLREVNQHAYYDAICRDYSTCAAERIPLVSRNSFINDQGVFWKYERILLPLGAESGRVDMILGGMDINIPLSKLVPSEVAGIKNLSANPG